MDHQKGPDITLEAVPGLAARGCQVLPIRVMVRFRVRVRVMV